MVYLACAVTTAMTKWTQGKSRPVEKVSTTYRDGEEQLELADTFIAHDKELASEQCVPVQDGSDQGENNQTQGMEVQM